MNTKKIISETIFCPSCSVELELDEVEKRERKFTCPQCKTFVEIKDKGMSEYKQTIQTPRTLFLYIPITRLILLSIISLCLYESYWIYKNWQYIKERDNMNIRPFWRGIFGIFFCHSLLQRIHDDQDARSAQIIPNFSPGVLATCWVIFIITTGLITRFGGLEMSIIAAFIPSFLFFIPVQNYVNIISRKTNPKQEYYGWSSGHIVCLVYGIFYWTILLIALSIQK